MDKFSGSSPILGPCLQEPNLGRDYGDEASPGRIKSAGGRRYIQPSSPESTPKGRSVLKRGVSVPHYTQPFMKSPPAFHMNLVEQCIQYLAEMPEGFGSVDFQRALTPERRILCGKRREKVIQAVNKLQALEPVFLAKKMIDVLERLKGYEDADDVMADLLMVKDFEFQTAYSSGSQKDESFRDYLQMNAQLLEVLKLVAPHFDEGGGFMEDVEDSGFQDNNVRLPSNWKARQKTNASDTDAEYDDGPLILHPKYKRTDSEDSGIGDYFPSSPTGDDRNPWGESDFNPGDRRPGSGSDPGDDRFRRRGSSGPQGDYPFGSQGSRGAGGLGGIKQPPYGSGGGRKEGGQSPYARDGANRGYYERKVEPFQSKFGSIYPSLAADPLKAIDLSPLNQEISERERQIQQAENLLGSAQKQCEQEKSELGDNEILLSELDEINKQLVNGSSVIEEMKFSKLDLENKKDRLRGENEEVCKNLNDKLNQILGDYDNAREKLFSLEKDLEELRGNLKEYPSDLFLKEEIDQKEKALYQRENLLRHYRENIDNIYKKMDAERSRYNDTLDELRSVFTGQMDSLDERLKILIANFENGINGLRHRDKLDDDESFRGRIRGDGSPEREIDRYGDDLEFDSKERLRKGERGRDPVKDGGRTRRETIQKLSYKFGDVIQGSFARNLNQYSNFDRQYAELDERIQTTGHDIQKIEIDHKNDVENIENITKQEGEEFWGGDSADKKSLFALIENINYRNKAHQKRVFSLEDDLQSYVKEKERIDSQLKEEVGRTIRLQQQIKSDLDSVTSEIEDEHERRIFANPLEVDMRLELERLDVKKAELERDSQQCGEKIVGLQDRLSDLKSSISNFSNAVRVARDHVSHRGESAGLVDPKNLINRLNGMDRSHEDDMSLSNSTVNLGEMLLRPGSDKKIDIHNNYINDSKLEIDDSPLTGLPDALKIELYSIKRDLGIHYGELEHELTEIDNHHKVRNFADENTPPHFSDVRKYKKSAYDRFCKYANQQKERVKNLVASDEFKKMGITHHQIQNVIHFYACVNRCSSRIEKAGKLLKKRESHFQEAIKRGSAIHLMSGDSAYDKVSKVHSLLDHMDKDGQEVFDYCAGELVMKVVKDITADAERAIDPNSIEDMNSFHDCLAALGLLKTKEMPGITKITNLGVQGRAFIDQVVERAIEGLYAKAEELNPSNTKDMAEREQFSGGIEAAKNMIQNQNIVPSVLALLNSLKPKHENVDSKVDYYKASADGLKAIRDEFRLKSMPCMYDLLLAAQIDLDSPISKLAQESIRQHRGQTSDKKHVSRQDKLKGLCSDLIKKERPEIRKTSKKGRGKPIKIAGPPAGAEALRAHPVDATGKAAGYFHQEVMDAFGSAKGILNLDTMASAGEDDQQVRHVFHVTGTDNAPMNTLFTDVEGAELVTSKVSGEQFVQIGSSGAQPKGVVFKKTGEGDWQVSLGNDVWTANPSFLYDHPRVHIPFGKRVDGDQKRDWIPVKNEAGETAILALRKTPNHVSYFLYKKGVGEELAPRAIRGGDFKREKTEAEFFYRAACGKARDVSSEQSYLRASDSVKRLKGAHSIPYIEGTEGQLQGLYELVQADMAARLNPPPLPMTDQVDLSTVQVKKSDEQQIQENKESRKSKDGGPGNLVDATEQLFTKFSVAATFDGVSEAYLYECRGDLEELSPDLEEAQKDLKTFKEQAFQKMTVYQGCELNFNVPQVTDRKKPAEGHPACVCQNLEKVIKVNRDHRMRLTQTIPHLTSEITTLMRETADSKELAKYTDEELVQFAISEFEEGRLPVFRGNSRALLEKKAERYTQAVVDLLLSRNDLAHSGKMAAKLQGLMNKLVELDKTIQSKTMNQDDYKSTCQTLNLEMAMLATEQKMVSERMDSYSRQTLDTTNIVILGFEQGGTVLRGSQTKVVREIMGQLANMGREPVKLIYQLGTGYGKSKTIIPITVERAFRKGCPVRVIAPVTNQAELDISLSRTFAKKGIPYYTLDIMNEYAKEGEQWWLPNSGGQLDCLDRIHNTILGLPRDTLPEQRGSKEAERSRGPSGISVRDVQILLQLRGRLQRKVSLSMNEKRSLAKLDKIADDLIRDGMNVFDEWDRTALPNRAEELEDLEEDINRALSGFKEKAVDHGPEVKQQVTSNQIIESQGAFLIGCQNGLYLSATVGTTYTAALLSGSLDAAEVASRCNSDPMTTSPRFWHWMNNATPVFIHNSADNTDVREQVFRQVMAQSGCDKELVIFDGNDDGDQGVDAIVKDFRMIDSLRKEMGGESRGMLFYDNKKQLHKFKAGDPKYDNQNKGAELPEAEERLIRANKGKDVDVRLDRTSAVGIDPPQGRDSVGVHFGLYEDQECRLDLFKQQFGRFSRESDNLQHQSFYVVVDVSNLEDVEADDSVKKAFQSAHKEAQEAEHQLVTSMGVELSECTAEQKKALYGQLQVPPPDPREKNKDKAMEEAVSKEIDRLSRTEWKGFSAGQKTALKAFKLAQWHEKKNYLMMTAQVLARRDVTEHTVGCEDSLQKGARFCEADRILAEEHKWLHGDAVKVVKDVVLKPPQGSRKLDNPETLRLVSQALKRECIRQLEVAPRRKLKAEETGGEINLQKVAKSPYLKEQVDMAIKKVASKGVSVQGYQYPEEVQELVSRSARPMCDQANEIYSNVCSILKSSGTTIPVVLSSSNGRLLQHMAALKDPNKCVDEGVETEAVVREFYKSLVHGMRKVTFSMFKGENKGNFNKRTQQACRDLLIAMSPVAAYISSQPKLGEGWNLTFNHQGEAVVMFHWPGTKSPESAKDSSIAKIKRGFLPKLAPLSGASDLQDAREKTENHRQKARQRHNAVEFCMNPHTDEYKACIEQIRQQLDEKQAEYGKKVVEFAEKAELRMNAQASLMQMPPEAAA